MNAPKTTLGTLSAILGLVIAASAVYQLWTEHGWVTQADMRRTLIARDELTLDITAKVLAMEIRDLTAAGRHDEAKRVQGDLDAVNAVRASQTLSLDRFR